jgi:hypothetical protein
MLPDNMLSAYNMSAYRMLSDNMLSVDNMLLATWHANMLPDNMLSAITCCLLIEFTYLITCYHLIACY